MLLLRPGSDLTTQLIVLPTFPFHHKPRPVGRGGGFGFLISKLFKVNLHTSPDYSSFQSICVDISNPCFSGYIICFYHPPCHLANFFEEFQDLLENVATMHT